MISHALAGIFAKVLAPSDPEQAQLDLLFEEIAAEQGWQSGDQLRAYHGHAVFFALILENEVVGGLELVRGGPGRSLPCLSVWPELNLLGREDVADVALLALRADVRGKPSLMWLLCIALRRYCYAHGIRELWIEANQRILNRYNRFGWPFEIAGPQRRHWGEECYPANTTIAAIDEQMEKRAKMSPFYALAHDLAHRDGPLHTGLLEGLPRS